jgi:hypothetical protein
MRDFTLLFFRGLLFENRLDVHELIVFEFVIVFAIVSILFVETDAVGVTLEFEARWLIGFDCGDWHAVTAPIRNKPAHKRRTVRQSLSIMVRIKQ